MPAGNPASSFYQRLKTRRTLCKPRSGLGESDMGGIQESTSLVRVRSVPILLRLQHSKGGGESQGRHSQVDVSYPAPSPKALGSRCRFCCVWGLLGSFTYILKDPSIYHLSAWSLVSTLPHNNSLTRLVYVSQITLSSSSPVQLMNGFCSLLRVGRSCLK